MTRNLSRNIETGNAVRAFFIALLFLACCPFIFPQAVQGSPANLAPTPPMGWASWNHFFCDYNEQTIRNQADALVSTGMRDLGYRYVLIQECIAPKRDSHGALIVDPVRFPYGMKALVDYIHARGLKAGTYTDIGLYTCYPKPRYQGSFRHEDQDAATFASWGMDFVEMDYCNHPPGHTGREIYERMAAAIQKTGRPMLFYICSWGNESPWTWAHGKAELWRTTGDISSKKNHVEWAHVVENFESNARHGAFSAPNSWNDPDMLEVGNPGLNNTEAQSHFAMWAISAAPLWAGNDLTRMDDSIRRIYTNSEAIAVDQDPLGAGAVKVGRDNKGLEVWSKPLARVGSGQYAVLLLNLTAAPADVSVLWSDLTLSGKVRVRDMWAHKDLGEFPNLYTTRVPAHGSALLKVSGKFNWTKGATYEAEWPGNVRGGNATLLGCAGCNQGYAVTLQESKDASNGSSLQFTHINVPRSGSYSMIVSFAAGDSGYKTLHMRVNQEQPKELHLSEPSDESSAIPIKLSQGDNSITFRSTGTNSVDIDRVRIVESWHSAQK